MVETTRRREIEDAASTLFHEHGYSGTSVRDIARALDIQGASLYAHVASKQEVLWSIVERTATRFEAAADAVEAGDPDATDAPARRPPDLAGPRPRRGRDRRHRAGERLRPRVALARRAAGATTIARRRDAYEARFRTVIEHGIDVGPSTRSIPLAAAAYILTALNGLVAWYRPERPAAGRATIADAYADLSLARRPARTADGTSHDRPARARPDPGAAGARPAGVQRGPAARRAVRAVRGARRRRRQGRGDRLDARRVPDRRPALRRDARQQRADGRPARARVADARADPPPQARADRQGPGRGRPRPAAVPGRRGPRQAARGDVRRPARRQDQVPQRLPLPDGRLGRRRDDRLAGRRRRDRRPAGAARLVATRRTPGRCARSAGRNRSTSCMAATSS